VARAEFDAARGPRYKASVLALSDPAQALAPWSAAALGALQGVTEFLPVSSSGHLSLAQLWLHIDPATAGHRFNVLVHAATLLAVAWVYRADLLELVLAALRPGRATPERMRLLAVIVGTLPLGLVLIEPVEAAFVAMESSARAVGTALLVTAAMLLYAARTPAATPTAGPTSPPTWGQALAIGLVQLCAVAPGISRSGSTIAAGLALGLAPREAARFSFLLSVPAVLAATAKEALEIQGAAAAGSSAGFAVGFVSALVVGLASLRLLLLLVDRNRLAWFVPYLAALGLTALVLGP
jgi:undecaprenyl-diphosphatase